MTSQTQSLFNVDGLIAVITGGASGIGAMLARALSLNGASAVYILDIDSAGMQDVVSQAVNGNIHSILCDVTSVNGLQAAVDEVTARSGFINLLICNAGVAPPIPVQPPTAASSIEEVRAYFLDHLQPDDYAKVLRTNTTSVLLTAFSFLGLLDAGNKASPSKPKSQIVTVSSAGAFVRGPQDFIYNASKAATTHMMKSMATNLVPWDIRSNIIAPGWFHSKITEPMAEQYKVTGGVLPKEMTPQKRFGSENEMAGTILYLASEAGGNCNGGVFLLDGGVLSIQPSAY